MLAFGSGHQSCFHEIYAKYAGRHIEGAVMQHGQDFGQKPAGGEKVVIVGETEDDIHQVEGTKSRYVALA